jgi:hypothetical protein
MAPSERYRDGFKAHGGGTRAGIIVAATLTAGNVAEAQAAPELLADEDGARTVFGDSPTAPASTGTAHRAGHATVIKPSVLRRRSPAACRRGLRDRYQASTVTCPAGNTLTIRASRTASFARHCQRCRCTNARAGPVIRPHPDHDRLHDARCQAEDPSSGPRTPRPRRWGERSISWLVADGCGKSATAASNATATGFDSHSR